MRANKTNIYLEAIAAFGAFLFVSPLVFLVLTSFKPKQEVLNFESVLPKDWTLENYAILFANSAEIPIGTWLLNSLLVSAFTTLFVLVCVSLAAYTLSRLSPPGGKWILVFLISTMVLPGQVLLVPLYLILNWLGWIDTPRALVLPAASSAFGVFLLYQFFKSIPKELEEAAQIDGCGSWGRFIHIALPHAKSAMTALGIITFIGSWNDFLGPLVFLDSVERYTMPLGLALFQSSYAMDYGLLFAASVISSLPLLVIFIFFQKHIIKGISFTGMKD